MYTAVFSVKAVVLASPPHPKRLWPSPAVQELVSSGTKETINTVYPIHSIRLSSPVA